MQVRRHLQTPLFVACELRLYLYSVLVMFCVGFAIVVFFASHAFSLASGFLDAVLSLTYGARQMKHSDRLRPSLDGLRACID